MDRVPAKVWRIITRQEAKDKNPDCVSCGRKVRWYRAPAAVCYGCGMPVCSQCRCLYVDGDAGLVTWWRCPPCYIMAHIQKSLLP